MRDNNQCCFGDMSTIKYYDQMDVNMVGSRRVDYRQGVFRMGGDPEDRAGEPGRGRGRLCSRLRSGLLQLTRRIDVEKPSEYLMLIFLAGRRF